MKILVMSDIHGKWGRFYAGNMPDPSEIHFVLVAGDITNTGKPRSQAVPDSVWGDWANAQWWVESLCKRYGSDRVLWVPGNHDLNVDTGDMPGTMLYQRKFAHNLHTRSGFHIIGTSLCTAFDTPELAERWAHTTSQTWEDLTHWNTIAQNTEGYEGKNFIVVSHCPPYKCLDEAHTGVRLLNEKQHGETRHIGSPGLTNFIRHKQPALVVCGHVHEAAGEAMMGETRVINTACRWQVVEL